MSRIRLALEVENVILLFRLAHLGGWMRGGFLEIRCAGEIKERLDLA